MKPTKPLSPKAVDRRYLWEASLGIAAYVGAMLLAGHALHGWKLSEPIKLLIALVPLIPLALVFLAVIRFIRHTDEMLRRLHIEALAIAAGTTAFLALLYGCLELAGFPPLSVWWTFMSIDLIWGFTVCVLQWRRR